MACWAEPLGKDPLVPGEIEGASPGETKGASLPVFSASLERSLDFARGNRNWVKKDA
jgi:hypothetical protein